MSLHLRALQAVALQLRMPDGPWYPSRLVDFEEGAFIVVDPPVGGQGAILLEPGTPVVAEIVLPDGLRRFHLSVTEVDRYRNTLKLDWPRDGEKIQRRDHVRVQVRLPAKLVLGGADEPGEVVEGITSDLSAGGVRINLARELRADQAVGITLDMPEEEVIECEGRVVRCGELNARTEERYWAAIEFKDLDPATLREITRAIFDIQREQMKRAAY